MLKYILSAPAIVLMAFVPLQREEKPPYTFVQPVYQELPLGSIKPKGWLLHQLQIMSKGSTGHLDEVHAKIANDNGWLGGKGDGWEETPYWLDGAVPLAYLLDDAALKTKVLKYIRMRTRKPA